LGSLPRVHYRCRGRLRGWPSRYEVCWTWRCACSLSEVFHEASFGRHGWVEMYTRCRRFLRLASCSFLRCNSCACTPRSPRKNHGAKDTLEYKAHGSACGQSAKDNGQHQEVEASRRRWRRRQRRSRWVENHGRTSCPAIIVTQRRRGSRWRNWRRRRSRRHSRWRWWQEW